MILGQDLPSSTLLKRLVQGPNSNKGQIPLLRNYALKAFNDRTRQASYRHDQRDHRSDESKSLSYEPVGRRLPLEPDLQSQVRIRRSAGHREPRRTLSESHDQQGNSHQDQERL